MSGVLVLGATGMLGHKVWQACEERTETWATVRTAPTGAIPSGARVIGGIEDADGVARALELSDAETVINCIGVIKQAPESSDPLISITTNSLLPHRVAAACAQRGARLIQISTDCVFSGRQGDYSEQDLPDPADLYGRSKLLGELTSPGAVTLRTSIIGRELRGGLGLLEWLLAQRGGTVRGFTRARFSGLTTNEFAGLLTQLALGELSIDDGLWHVSAEPISKHDLLVIARDALRVEVEIVEDDGLALDRTLDSSRFREATGWHPRSWPEQLAELAADPTDYRPIAEGEHAR
jgi:dTDP-4-dehydrorhamnose reductase